MNKNILIAVVVIIVLGLTGIIGYAARKRTSSVSNSVTATPSGIENSVDSLPSVSVTISNFAFTPAVLTVKKGTPVTWTNQDTVSHTVTADQPSANAPKSSLFSSGQRFVFTFSAPGTYTYHCAVHGSMAGTIIVTE